MEYDLKIIGGMIADGTGQPAFQGDVGIKAGKIAALGDAHGGAGEVIDAGGLVVAPGFVDIHTHYDAQIFWDRMMTISPWHGVTTVAMGNCGFGVAPTRPEHRGLIMRTLEKVEGMSIDALEAGLGYEWPFETFPQYLDAIEKRGTAINTAVLVGHTPVRLYVMGEEATERTATPAEIARMHDIVRSAIDAGAIGFATSKSATHVGFMGKPVPSRAATIEEIKTLAGSLGEAGQGVMQATIGKDLYLKEFKEIARTTGRTVTWTALLAGARGNGWEQEQLVRSADLVREGLRVVPQVNPRPLNFEFQFKAPFVFENMPLFRPVSQADFDGKMRIYADPAFRDAFKAKAAGPTFVRRWATTAISHCPADPSIEERTVAEVARDRGVNPVDLMLDIALATRLEARFRMAVFNHDESEVGQLLTDRNTVIGLSDAGAHASQLCDACTPTYLLARWVREKGAIAMEEAVRMLTSRPAEVFGITDRGRLAAGMPADVVIFDPATVGAGRLRRVYDMPAGADRLVSDASGIEGVIVNGTVIRRGGKDTVDPQGPLPGKVLRNGRARG
jgi:N-acyl-D-aspartate/D-glutamate deacylase